MTTEGRNDHGAGCIIVLVVALLLSNFVLEPLVLYWFADTDRGFFAFLGRLLLAAVGWVLALLVAAIAVFVISRVVVEVCERINRRQATLFSHADPRYYDRLRKSIHEPLIGFVFASSAASIISLLVLHRIAGLSLFMTLVVVISVSLGLFWGRIVLTFRTRQKWSYYHARRLAIPCLVASGLSILLTALGLYALGYAAVFLLDYAEVLGVYTFGFDDSVRGLFPVSPWQVPILEPLQAFGWSAAIAVLVVWFIPLVAKRDYAAIVLSGLVVVAPFFGEFLSDYVRRFAPDVGAVLDFVPAPVLSVMLAVLLELLIKFVRGRLSTDIECPRCRFPVSPPALFCPMCAMEIPPVAVEPSPGKGDDWQGAELASDGAVLAGGRLVK